MPYFWWEGITLRGNIHSGYSFAPSAHYLEQQLFKQQIALTKTKDYSFLIHFYSINITDKADFYAQLASLLENGIQLAPAFTLIAQQTPNPAIQKILFSCSIEIEGGMSINNLLPKYTPLFDILACQIVAIGVETGTLTTVCTMLSHYYKQQALFNKKMKTALLTPLLTGAGVILVGLFIFIFFIPKISVLFKTLSVPLPALTKKLIGISNVIQSTHFLYITCFGVALIIMCVLIKQRSVYIQNKLSSIYYHTPFIRVIIRMHAQAHFFSFLSILLNSGITLPNALAIITQVFPRGPLRTSAVEIRKQVEAGQAMGCAMATQPLFFDAHQIAIITLAQETACLPAAIQNIAKKNTENIESLMAHIIFWTGPLLLICLGFSVALLMIAVYSPLINLSASLG